MELIFPYRKDRNFLEYYSNKKDPAIVKLNKDTLINFYIKNHIFQGFEDYIAGKVISKLTNHKTLIMGILNATPDSFYPGSRLVNNNIIDNIIDQKPDIIDLGGESTRPGSEQVEPEIEFGRLKGPLEYIKSVSNIPVSIDSRNYYTISRAIKYNIDYINDISGFTDINMIKLASETGLKCIVMHMVGNPQTMSNFTHYENLFYEVNEFFYKKTDEMIKNNIEPENIILDPGIGFSKGFEENMAILKSPWAFFLGFDTLFGTSRKGFIGKVTGSEVQDRLPGTIATSIYLNQNGVDFLRVHDPKENKEAILMYNCINNFCMQKP